MADDFLSIMKVLPDPNAFMEGQQQAASLQQTNLQNQTGQFQLQQAQQTAAATQAKQAAYQQDLAKVVQSPTQQGILSLKLKYPDQAKTVSDAFTARDTAAQNADRQQLATVYSLLDGGYTDIAQKQLEDRLTADQQAGRNEPMVQTLLDTIKANPDHAKGVAAVLLSQIPGGDDFAKTLKAVGDTSGSADTKGQVVGRAIGHYEGTKWITDYRDPDGAKYEKIKDANGQEHLVEVGGNGATAAPTGQFDARQFFHDFTLPHEGGYAAHDANGAPVNMGVNQAANPGVDVKNLTPDQAADIFANKYAAKAANLPAPLAAAYADTAYINPARADQFLTQSGGDANKFLALRKAWQGSLVANQPEKYAPYAKAWAKRNADLAAYVNGQGSQAPSGARDITPTNLKGGDPASSGPFGIPADAAGPAALQALPAPIRSRVQQLLDGRSILTAREKGQPMGQQLLAAANQIDPTYDEGTAPVRFKTQQAYAPGGVVGKQLTAARTVIDHLYELAAASEKLGGGSLKFINSAMNYGKGQANDPALIKYNNALTNIATELPSFLKGGQATIPEEAQMREDLSPNLGDAGRKEAIDTKLSLLAGKVQPLVDGYNQAMGTQKGQWELIPPAQQAKLTAVQNWLRGGKLGPEPHPAVQANARASSGMQAPQGQPVRVTTPAQAMALPSGTKFMTPDGRVKVRP